MSVRVNYRRHFKDCAEFLAVKPATAKLEKSFISECVRFNESSASRLASWYGDGIKSIADLDARLSKGWADGVKRARAAIGEITIPKMSSTKRRLRWGAEGDEIDPDRLRSGDFETAYRGVWREIVEGKSSAPVKIRISMGANCHTPAEAFFWRGALACVLTDAIEASGRTCIVEGYTFTRQVFTSEQDGRTFVSFTMKGDGEPMDVDRIAAFTACPGAFRHYGFKAYHERGITVNSHMGHDLSNREHPPVDEADEGMSILTIANVWSLSDVKAWLARSAMRDAGFGDYGNGQTPAGMPDPEA